MRCWWLIGFLCWQACCGELTAAGESEFYRLREGDRVKIQVFGNPEYTVEGWVYAAAPLHLPKVGALKLVGKTPWGAAEEIAELVEKKVYLKSPLVTLVVTDYAPSKVYVQGEVGQPQEIVIPRFQEMTLTMAVAKAGGITAGGDQTDVRLVRKRGEGRQEAKRINLAEVFAGKAGAENPRLEEGDEVYVPRAKGYYVLGAVKSPGAFSRAEFTVPLDTPITLLKAITRAGGFGEGARCDKVRLVRHGGGGLPQVVEVDVERLIASGRLEDDPALAPGDVVVVDRHVGMTILGDVKTPGVYYPEAGRPLTLLGLLARAGGTTRFADQSRVRITRQMPDGTIKTFVIDVGKMQEEGPKAKDIVLAPGDFIFVPERWI